jgi:hypothetical protein
MSKRIVNFPPSPPFGTTHFEHGRTFEYVEPGMWKSVGGSGGDGEGGGEGGFLTWQKVVVSGFQCEANNQYLDVISTASPTVSLPQLTNADEGAFVEIADGRAGWATEPLTVALNGPLQGDGATTVVLDFDRVICTFVWSGAEWTIYTTASNRGIEDAPEDGFTYGRQDGQWVQVSGGGGGTGGSVEWGDVLNKPAPIVNLAGETKASFVQGGNY